MGGGKRFTLAIISHMKFAVAVLRKGATQCIRDCQHFRVFSSAVDTNNYSKDLTIIDELTDEVFVAEYALRVADERRERNSEDRKGAGPLESYLLLPASLSQHEAALNRPKNWLEFMSRESVDGDDILALGLALFFDITVAPHLEATGEVWQWQLKHVKGHSMRTCFLQPLLRKSNQRTAPAEAETVPDKINTNKLVFVQVTLWGDDEGYSLLLPAYVMEEKPGPLDRLAMNNESIYGHVDVGNGASYRISPARITSRKRRGGSCRCC
eukprot:6203877-Pleurochrysis_carterae.AAC.1